LPEFLVQHTTGRYAWIVKRVQDAVKRWVVPLVAGALVATACANGSTSAAPSTSPAPPVSLSASPSVSPELSPSVDELPAIVVTKPSPGDTVSSPVTVAGTADVFEATVSIRILDANRKKIADTFTTATCGTGCRGDFSKQVDFTVSAQQQGTVMVFESSAENGRPINVVRIPVTLSP
jgi:hypothetical protein